jgi:hypothetical protein
VELIVGIHNKGQKDFSLTALEGSLRYPMDYTFYMQNFSTLLLDQYVVPPGRQGSVFYTFVPSDTFGSRSFGLVLALSYHGEVCELNSVTILLSRCAVFFFPKVKNMELKIPRMAVLQKSFDVFMYI